MAALNLGDILVRLGLDASAFTRGLRQASRNLTQLGSAARTAGVGLTSAITVPLVGGAAAATKFAADFDDAMTQSLAIFSEFRESTKDVNQDLRAEMEKTAESLAVNLAIPASKVAEGFFFLASAGLDAQESIQALPIVARFAKAGMFDLAEATSLSTDVMKAMELQISDLTRVTDVLVKANTLADATTQQFSEALTNQAAAALSFANKSLEEGVAVLALFAERGIKGRRAGRLLARAIRDLGDKAVRNQEAFRKFGISVFDSSGAMRNMADISDDLTKAFGSMSDAQRRAALIQLGFTVRAQEAILTLINSGESLREFEEKLNAAGGTTKDVAENQLESFKQQMASMQERIKDAAREFGDVFLPIILNVVDKAVIPLINFVKEAGKAFAELPTFVQVGIIAFGGLVAAVGPILIIVGQLLITLGSLVLLGPSIGVAFGVIASAAGTVLSTLGALLPVIGAVAAAFLVGFGLGKIINDAFELDRKLKSLVESMFDLKDAAKEAAELRPISESDIRLIEEAEKLLKAQGEAFAVIPRSAEGLRQATEIMNEHIQKLREGTAESENFAKTAEQNARANLPALASAFGATVPEMEAIADRLGITLAELEDLATGSDKVGLELEKLRNEMRDLVTTMAETQAQVDKTSQGIQLSGGIAALSAQEQKRLGEEFLEASKKGAVLGGIAQELVNRLLDTQAAALTAAGAVAMLQKESDEASMLIERAGGAAQLSSAALEENARRFIELERAGGVLNATQQAVIDRFMLMQSVALSAAGNVDKLSRSANELAQQIELAGGATNLSRDALEQAAKQFEALEKAGGTLSETQREVVDLNRELTETQKAAAAEAEAFAKRQSELSQAMEGFRNAAGIATVEAQRSFETFSQSVSTVLEETGGVVSKEFRDKIIAEARRLKDEFPALKGEVDAFLESTGTGITATAESTTDWNQRLENTANLFKILGISADSALGRVLGNITALGSAFDQFSKIGADFGGGIAGFGKGLKDQFSKAAESAGGGILGGISGALSIAGPIASIAGPAISAIGGIISGFFKSESEKIADDIERDFGVKISDALAKSIEETADRLDVGRFEARLLNLGDIITEAGGAAEFGLGQAEAAIIDLQNAVALGLVPAEEGISEIGEAFNLLAEDAVKSGRIASAELLNVVNRARELGQEIPEIAQFIASELERASKGLTLVIGTKIEGEKGAPDVFGGIQIASPEQAQAQATLFSSVFFATLEEQGLKAAVDALGPAFDALQEKIQAFGTQDVDFGGVGRFFEIARDPKFGPLLDGIQGLNDALVGLGNAGFLTVDAFNAVQTQAGAAFDQLIEAGLTAPEALQQLAPTLQSVIDASQRFGFTIDDDTQKLIDQAAASGIAFDTDPMQRMVEVLEVIATKLGATAEELGIVADGTAGVGESAVTALSGTSEVLDGVRVSAMDTLSTIGEGVAMTSESVAVSLESAGLRGANGIRQAAAGLTDVAAAGDMAATEIETQFGETADVIDTKFGELVQGSMESFMTITEGSEMAVQAVTLVGDAAGQAAGGFDALARSARDAASAAASARGPGGEAPGGPGRERAFQFGGLVTGPTRALLGERGPELVLPLANAARSVEVAGAVSAGRQAPVPIQLTIQVGSETFLAQIEDATRTNKIRIHERSVQAFGD